MLKRLSYLLLLPLFVYSQNGEVHGDFTLNLQTYTEDASINAKKVDEFMLMNGFSNIRFNKGNFTTGLRYESYLNALQDFDGRHNGNGIPFRFANYKIDNLEITIGNFYEQFGNGLIFRSYEEKNLGIDNVMDGILLKYSLSKGLQLKGFVGKQRFFFEHGPGIIRGLDAEIHLNQMFSYLEKSNTNILIGGSFVSRFQTDANPIYNLPENVGAFAIRNTISREKISINTEYAYKYNDPAGGLTYNNFASGSALITNLSYSPKPGLSIYIEAHRSDNMDFRSDRGANGKELTLSFIPTITKQHTYTLAGLYPYATQPKNELGFQGEVTYKFTKKSTLGGKYGTDIYANYSRVNSLNGGNSVLTTDSTESHTPMFLSIEGEELYFRDFNFGFTKKINQKIKILAANYVDIIYNKDIIEGKNYGKNIHARIGLIDINYKIKKRKSIRTELHYLSIDKNKKYDQDQGDWMMGLVEYTNRHWFFTISDQYNNGYIDYENNSFEAIHYINVSCGYTKGSTRFELGYGKKREGIFCAGGICKNVPSSNGLTLNITSSF